MVANSSPSLPVTADAILDDIGLFLAVAAPDGTTLFVNKELLRRLSKSIDAVAGRPIQDAIWTLDTEVAAQLKQAVDSAAQGRVARMEIETPLDSDQPSAIELEIRPSSNADGSVVAVVVEGRDVTTHRAIERKLRDAHFRWRTIADFTVDWEFWLHPSGHFLYSSPSCQRMTGRPPDDFLEGRVTLATVAHDDDRKQLVELLTDAFSGSTAHSQPWRLMHSEDGVRHVSMSWQPVYGSQGRFMGVRGSVRDVTDVWQAEDELHRLVEAYRTLAKHFPRGLVALLDRDLRLMVCDGPAFKTIPVEPSSLQGKRIHDVLDRGQMSKVQPLLTAAMSGREMADVVRVGDATWLVHITPIPDDDGTITHIIVSGVERPDVWAETGEQPTRPGHAV